MVAPPKGVWGGGEGLLKKNKKIGRPASGYDSVVVGLHQKAEKFVGSQGWERGYLKHRLL